MYMIKLVHFMNIESWLFLERGVESGWRVGGEWVDGVRYS